MPTTRLLAEPPRLGRLLVRSRLGRSAGGRADVVLALRGQRFQPDRLAAYQRLCGFRVDAVLPVTAPHVLAFPLGIARMAEPDFPLPVLGLVHVENTIRQHRPITFDEPLDLAVTSSEVREHRAGRQVDIIAEARCDDELVWQSISTYLRREHRPTGPRPARSPDPQATDARAVLRIPADVGRRYAAVSGDRNPIHLSRVGARAFGFPRPIAHGMWLAARAVATLEGAAPTGAVRFEVGFKAPTPVPATVAVRESRAAEGGWYVEMTALATGRRHLEATIVPG
ncbi:MAG: hypothetical protein JO147_03580 [Actinobacteria bacterium]|nr:hypothetical protein [Actinomycetota bacterium]